MNGPDVAWVGLAGALGAVARFWVDGALRARFATVIPVGTFAVNLSGSLVLGVLTGLVLFHGAPATLTVVAGSGFCGGYTTFSTASFEVVRLLQRGQRRDALVVGGTMALGALGAAALGLSVAWL